MIGNESIVNMFSSWSANKTTPHFIVMYGEAGCGKRTLAKQLAVVTHRPYIECDSKIDDVRKAIELAYTQTDALLLFNADTMTNAAKQALLKTVEEELRNVILVMIASNDRNIPDTLLNRAYRLDVPWNSEEELEEAYDLYCTHKDPRLIQYCDTIGQMIDIDNKNPKKFFDFADLFVHKIGDVSDVNAFKASERALKEFDPVTLMRVVSNMFYELCNDENGKNFKYIGAYFITHEYLDRLTQNGMNKQSVVDCWVKKLRKHFKGVEE